MRQFVLAGLVISALSSVAHAGVFVFSGDPFAGSTALATPGRQIVGGEPTIGFDTALDQFVFDAGAFGQHGFALPIGFANDTVGNLPTGGANIIVLRTLDDDNNSATAFGAGNAANLIAGRVTSAGTGFFIYFNSVLNLPRLVFSTNLDDNTADLKIVARMTNLQGTPGALAGFTAGNFTVVPEPGALLLFSTAAVVWAYRRRRP